MAISVENSQFFLPGVFNAPMKGALKGALNTPWNLVSAQGVTKAYVMELPDDRKSFKIGLVVLIQYRL